MLGPRDLQNLNQLIDKDTTLPLETLPEDYLVEHLDYNYVKDCSNVNELHHLLSVLK